jgi:thymidylate kinase
MTIAHLCVEGTKGAGKTTTIASALALLEAERWVVRTHALFHEGNAWAQEQGYAGGVPMMESSAEANERVARWLIARAASVRDEFAREREREGDGRPALLLSDRGWITLHAYLYEGAWAREGSLLPVIDALWAECLRAAPRTVFIHTRPAVSAQRRRGALDAVSGLQTEQRLVDDYDRRIRVAREHPSLIAASWETGAGPFVDFGPALVALLR